ncbi:MAG: lipocalin family protein [Phycisphaerales bacterium]|nr:lipocalin family protein [Phycisphaerales bacterium]
MNALTLKFRVDRTVFRCYAGVGLAAAAVVLTGGCSALHPPLPVVQQVDLARYTGKWYEIARYPNTFERGCTAATADYAQLEDGRIEVVNTCREGSVDGEIKTIRGTARVVDKDTNAKLKVTFFWPFAGDYWILALGDDYQWAVVGEPSRSYLWILSRTPTLDEDVYQDILSRLPALGYDPALLEKTVQPLDASAAAP